MVAIFEGQASLARTASAAAADLIREAIVDGRMLPGQRLKEEELAQQLGISRTPIREALLVLQTEGLLEATPNRGATVRSYDRADLEEMYDLRALLESHAARRAASRVTVDQLEALRGSCDRFAALVEEDERQAMLGENAFFHGTIWEAASSERLTGMIKQVVALPLSYKSFTRYTAAQVRASYDRHVDLTDALAHRQEERAAAVMREHVIDSIGVLVRNIDAGALAESSPQPEGAARA